MYWPPHNQARTSARAGPRSVDPSLPHPTASNSSSSHKLNPHGSTFSYSSMHHSPLPISPPPSLPKKPRYDFGPQPPSLYPLPPLQQPHGLLRPADVQPGSATSTSLLTVNPYHPTIQSPATSEYPRDYRDRQLDNPLWLLTDVVSRELRALLTPTGPSNVDRPTDPTTPFPHTRIPTRSSSHSSLSPAESSPPPLSPLPPPPPPPTRRHNARTHKKAKRKAEAKPGAGFSGKGGIETEPFKEENSSPLSDLSEMDAESAIFDVCVENRVGQGNNNAEADIASPHVGAAKTTSVTKSRHRPSLATRTSTDAASSGSSSKRKRSTSARSGSPLATSTASTGFDLFSTNLNTEDTKGETELDCDADQRKVFDDDGEFEDDFEEEEEDAWVNEVFLEKDDPKDRSFRVRHNDFLSTLQRPDYGRTYQLKCAGRDAF